VQTAAATTFQKMFEYAQAFDQNINSWKTGSATDTKNMFSGAVCSSFAT